MNVAFSCSARPLQHQRTLFSWGDANSQQAKEGGSFEECDAAKPHTKWFDNLMQIAVEQLSADDEVSENVEV